MKTENGVPLNEDELDRVSGGETVYRPGEGWAEDLYQNGQVLDFSSYRADGCCRRCGAAPLVGVITGVSSYNHTLRLEASCCRALYHLDVDNHVLT